MDDPRVLNINGFYTDGDVISEIISIDGYWVVHKTNERWGITPVFEFRTNFKELPK